MTVHNCDVLIIGGGLVGLSTAMHLQKMRPRLRVCLVEKETRLAAHQSGRNSGVVHAGIYYEPGSLKAQLCVEGKRFLKDYCAEKSIPYLACGKVIVATNEHEVARLDYLFERGCENKVTGLRLISRSELREVEPNVTGLKALHSPESAIVDYAKIAAAYAADFEAAGGSVHLGSAYLLADDKAGSRRVSTSAADFETGLVINCAGLHADLVARSMGTDPGLRIIPFRGDFFDLDADSKGLVKALIYPVPDPALPFLGVHLTPTVEGAVRAGPNAILATKREGYSAADFSAHDVANILTYAGFWRFSLRYIRPGIAELNRSMRKKVFVRSIQKLLPAISENNLAKSRSGVRAQAIDRAGRMVDDFRIEEAPGAIHILNAPSPAATSSYMIGKYVASKADLRINAH